MISIALMRKGIHLPTHILLHITDMLSENFAKWYPERFLRSLIRQTTFRPTFETFMFRKLLHEVSNKNLLLPGKNDVFHPFWSDWFLSHRRFKLACGNPDMAHRGVSGFDTCGKSDYQTFVYILCKQKTPCWKQRLDLIIRNFPSLISDTEVHYESNGHFMPLSLRCVFDNCLESFKMVFDVSNLFVCFMCACRLVRNDIILFLVDHYEQNLSSVLRNPGEKHECWKTVMLHCEKTHIRYVPSSKDLLYLYARGVMDQHPFYYQESILLCEHEQQGFFAMQKT